MTATEIETYLRALNDELAAMQVKGEICLYGGAAMCIAFKARPNTKDVDAVFEPSEKIVAAAKRVAERFRLDETWLNNAVERFVVAEHPRRIFLSLPNLNIYVADAEYLLAMKAIAAREYATDRADLRLLIQLLGIQTPMRVFDIIEKYYPRRELKYATRVMVEEIFDEANNA